MFICHFFGFSGDIISKFSVFSRFELSSFSKSKAKNYFISTIAIIFFILFDDRGQKLGKNSLHIHRNPLLNEYKTFFSPIHYILYIFLRPVNNYHHHNHYILFISLHCDNMDIIAIVYSSIAIIFFILFDDRGPELHKNSLRFHRHPPPP